MYSGSTGLTLWISILVVLLRFFDPGLLPLTDFDLFFFFSSNLLGRIFGLGGWFLAEQFHLLNAVSLRLAFE